MYSHRLGAAGEYSAYLGCLPIGLSVWPLGTGVHLPRGQVTQAYENESDGGTSKSREKCRGVEYSGFRTHAFERFRVS